MQISYIEYYFPVQRMLQSTHTFCYFQYFTDAVHLKCGNNDDKKMITARNELISIRFASIRFKGSQFH